MTLKILIVDDEPRIVETLRHILESKGYVTASAFTGDDAIAKARDFLPDLLLSDIMMPGIDGFEAALEIKQIVPGCRLLFLSGHSVAGLRSAQVLTDRGYQFQLLIKPTHPTILLRTLEEALVPA